jgi:cytochrome c
LSPRQPERPRTRRRESRYSRAARDVIRRQPGDDKIGPSLAGAFGRKSGSEPGYTCSPALKAANITWDQQTLDKFLANPTADVRGTKMFISVPNAADRQNVIAYLQTLK